jgi:hypothetical protein
MSTAKYRVRVTRYTHVKFSPPERQESTTHIVEAPTHSHGAKIAAQQCGMPKTLRTNGQSWWSNKVATWPESNRMNYTEWSVQRIYSRLATV